MKKKLFAAALLLPTLYVNMSHAAYKNETREFSASCSNGGLTGHTKFVIATQRNDAGKFVRISAYHKEYKITDNGRNKGNITLELDWNSGSKTVEIADDTARQDGDWHNLIWLTGSPVFSPQSKVSGGIFFKFDRGGADNENCWTTFEIK